MRKNEKKACKYLLTFFIAAVMLITLSSCFREDFDMTNKPLQNSDGANALRHIIDPDSEVRGVWIASVVNIDYPSQKDLSAEELKNEIDSILDACVRNKLNTIFFQVRPTCDALYDSDIFPVSEYLSSDGKLVFDPLGYIVKEAHLRNIYVHAWVNPLRVTMNSHDIDALDDKSPAKQHPEWTVAYDDGKLYLNAGLPEVRSLIADGVEEIVTKYDVDGVVFDDYFYPYPVYDDNGAKIAFADDEEYEKYGAGYADRDEWRRDNINKIIKAVYDTVHAVDRECVFGVSPFAIWQNDDGKNGGSKTNGFEAYKSLHCDALAWIDGGYVDYISPQIYWTFDTTSAPFDTLTRWWNTQLEGTDVKLYISHAAYRYEEGNWDSPEGQLKQQIAFARSERSYRGSIFYGYDEINRNIRGASDELLEMYRNEIIYTDIQSNSQKICLSSPASGSVLNTARSYVIGTSDPYYTLTVNGKKVGRTKSGCFNLLLELEEGENVFVFEENGERVEYCLTYRPDTASVPEARKDEAITLENLTIVNTYPYSEVATHDGSIFVSCVAPVGGSVSVNIGGKVTELSGAEVNAWSPTGYTGTTYSGYAKIPAAEAGSFTDCGNIKFTLTHSNGTVEAEGARVRSLGEGSVIGVRANKNYANMKISPTSSYYNDYTVQSEGMTSNALNLFDGYYLLSTGGYISLNDADETGVISAAQYGKIESVSVKNSEKSTNIVLSGNSSPAYNGEITDDGLFILTVFDVEPENAPEPVIGKNPIIESCESVTTGAKSVKYSFRLRNVENFYGYDMTYSDEGCTVSLRNPITLDKSRVLPLDGLNIVLDAGHGGEDRGAAGPVGYADSAKHEKQLNLAVTEAAAVKLRNMGASVSLTHEGDSTMSLEERMAYLREKEPDMCLSIHQNSIGYQADITKIRGTLALWCMDSGRMLSDCVGRGVSDALSRYYRGAQYQMLAMCRNPKFPQALVELGFITSVEEYEQLLSQNGIDTAADGIVNGILNWVEKMEEYAAL